MTLLPDAIIVCDEKHGTTYWDAQTDEAWATSSLAILTERFHDGWYPDPDNDGLGSSDWANNERKQNEIALAMTADQIAALPDDARDQVIRRRQRAQGDTAHQRAYREWYTMAKRVVEEQDDRLVTIGQGRWARQEPQAWLLLGQRADFEYERVTLEAFSRPREEKS